MKKSIALIFGAFCLSLGSLATAQNQTMGNVARITANDYVRQSIYVPVRDGTRLAVNIYRPASNSQAVTHKSPSIFIFTPYRARYHKQDGSIYDSVIDDNRDIFRFIQAGYNVVVADIRGKGASFGHRRGFQDRTEAMDGHDLIGWISQQEWATQNVGMFGCSYLGGTTFHTATTRPPALKAIFAGATDIDKYGFVRRGGITAQFNTRPDEPTSVDLASVPVDEDRDGAALRAAVAEHEKNTPMGPLWYGMQYRDSVSEFTGNKYWEEVGPYTYLNNLRNSGIATYFWGNLEDEPSAHSILSAANLNGRLFLGPGTHCVLTDKYDMIGDVISYFDYHLKGAQNGFDRTPKYTYFIDNAPDGHNWVKSNILPGQNVQRQNYYLSSSNDGSLQTARAFQSNTRFQVNYDVGTAEYFAFWVDARDDKGVTFTTQTFAADRILLGSAIARLKVSIDKPDANLFGYLEDVAPDGKIKVVSFGRLAASHRKVSRAPYNTLGLPYHSGLRSDVANVRPGQIFNMDFDLTPTSWLVKSGHKLRFVITGADPRQRNLAQIRQNPAPNITIHNGGANGSRIELPLLGDWQWPENGEREK